mmetsp:Transcript_87344/g.245168  ORF Transcript_87344/g.245168 Transcript_87344/m.245168 type:complete len:281 (-) Transcript_87344:124-966(-)
MLCAEAVLDSQDGLCFGAAVVAFACMVLAAAEAVHCVAGHRDDAALLGGSFYCGLGLFAARRSGLVRRLFVAAKGARETQERRDLVVPAGHRRLSAPGGLLGLRFPREARLGAFDNCPRSLELLGGATQTALGLLSALLGEKTRRDRLALPRLAPRRWERVWGTSARVIIGGLAAWWTATTACGKLSAWSPLRCLLAVGCRAICGLRGSGSAAKGGSNANGGSLRVMAPTATVLGLLGVGAFVAAAISRMSERIRPSWSEAFPQKPLQTRLRFVGATAHS